MIVYIGLGSNLGDRVGNLDHAIALLRRAPGVRLVESSPYFETPPWGVLAQPAFVNAAARLHLDLGPLQLLTLLTTVEQRVGRQRTYRWGPRIIDLDILLWLDFPTGGELADGGSAGSQRAAGGAVAELATLADWPRLSRRGLEVPHPRMLERTFVLVPLACLRPGLRGPAGESIEELIERAGSAAEVRRLG